MNNDFQKFAMSNGVSSLTLHDYTKGINAGYQCPSIIETSQMHGTTLDIFSRLMADRIIFLGTNVSPESANIITSQLLYLDNNGSGDISIYINSPGGDCYSGLELCSTMDFIKSNVRTTVLGMAASMGAVIASNGEKGKRSMLPYSRFMIHQPSSYSGRIKFTDQRIELEELEKTRNDLYEVLSRNSNNSMEKIIELCENGDKWLRADEAISLGFIDNVIIKK